MKTFNDNNQNIISMMKKIKVSVMCNYVAKVNILSIVKKKVLLKFLTKFHCLAILHSVAFA